MKCTHGDNRNGIVTISDKNELKGFSSEKLHRHRYHQFLLINKGVSLLIDSKQQQPQYGSLAAFIPLNLFHRSIVMGPSLIYQTIFVSEQLYRSTINSIVIFNISTMGKALFDYLCEENRRNFTEGYLGSCLNLFLQTIDRDLHNEASILRLPEPKNPINSKIVQFIHNNYQKKLKISDFETDIPYSSRHVSRIFLNEMKMTIIDYIKLYRILIASIQLHNIDANIKSIVYECGYDSVSNFYKDFGFFFNTTPNEYKLNIQHIKAH